MHPSSIVRRALGAAALFTLCGACGAADAPADEVARIVEVMGLSAGMRVADIGAGDGEYSAALAVRVGTAGHVFATEVEQDEVDDIRGRLADAGLDNVTVVLGAPDDTGLPADCCDAVLLRLVYHHFTDPGKMRASLRRALVPGAPLVVIEIRPQTHWDELEGVPDRGGHGISPEKLIAEMTADGFGVVARHDTWPEDDDHYCVVFRAIAGRDAGTRADGPGH